MVRGLGINPQPFQKWAPPRWGYFQSCYILVYIPHPTQHTAHSDGQLCPWLGLLLNTRFSADKNVAPAIKKQPVEYFFTQSDPPLPWPLVFSSPCTKRLFARILNMHYKHPPISLPGLPGVFRMCSNTCSEVCKGAAPCPIWDSPPAAAAYGICANVFLRVCPILSKVTSTGKQIKRPLVAQGLAACIRGAGPGW